MAEEKKIRAYRVYLDPHTCVNLNADEVKRYTALSADSYVIEFYLDGVWAGTFYSENICGAICMEAYA